MPRLPLARASARRRQFFTVVSTTIASRPTDDGATPAADAFVVVTLAETEPADGRRSPAELV
jgi:hypothetical protein